MLNCCYACGEYRADKIINDAGERPVAACPQCGHAHPFVMLPLLIVTGASGTGKSTILQRLIGPVSEPRIPPELFVFVTIFPFFIVYKSLFSEP